ncbi:MAG: lasso peptide biosynthesis B2 protein [Pseudomonadota bacterium]
MALKLVPLAWRKMRTAAGLPLSLLGLSGAVWLLLWPARLIVNLFPLRQLARFYGRDHGTQIKVPTAAEADDATARTIGQAIALAARYSPSSANCYPQALVARLLLRMRGTPHGLFFGLRRDQASNAMEAHAWVMVGEIPVSGGDSFDSYTVVRCFTSEGGA